MKIKQMMVAAMTAMVSAFAVADAVTDEYPVNGKYSVGSATTLKIGSSGYVCAKISLTPGKTYTFVVGGQEAGVALDILYAYKEDGEQWSSSLGSASWDTYHDSSRTFITTEDWEWESIIKGPDFDPEWDTLVKPSAYYVLVTGDEGTSVSVESYGTIVYETIPKGYPDNPETVAAPSFGKSVSKNVTVIHDDNVDGYYLKTTLSAGAKYNFLFSGDNANLAFYTDEPEPEPETGDEDEGAVTGSSTLVVYQLLSTEGGEIKVVGYSVIPVQKGTFYVEVLGDNNVALKIEAVRPNSTSAEAIPLSPVIGEDTQGTAPVTLSKDAWGATYRLSARKGVTYTVKADGKVVDPEGDELYSLPARIYTKSGSTEKEVDEADLYVGYTFTAAANQDYYFWIATDTYYGSEVETVIYTSTAGDSYGSLTVNLIGPETGAATFSLASAGTSAPKYASGSALILPAGAQTIKFSAATGWSTPANKEVVVEAGQYKVVDIHYNDSFDPKDDTAAGATVIKPTQVTIDEDWSYFGGLLVARSLWSAEGDKVDWFKFTVAAEERYWYDVQVEGDNGASPEFELYQMFGSTFTEQTAVKINLKGLTYLEKGTYYIRVIPGAANYNGTYRMTVGFADIGAVRLDKADTYKGDVLTKAAYSVKENAASVPVKLTRTGNSALILRFTTVAGTNKFDAAQAAIPGVDYEPVTTYVVWADGDKSTKTIDIPLIPDLYDTYTGNRYFSVELSPLDEGSMPIFGPLPLQRSATIEIVETAKAVPGTVGAQGYAVAGDEDTAFDNPKKPVIALVANDEASVTFSRTLGSAGKVGIRVETVKGTAAADVDFVPVSTDLYWNDGDTEDKIFTFSTLDSGAYTDRTMSLKVTALAADEKGVKISKPTLAASSVSVTIRNPEIASRLEEDVVLANTVKGTKGVWYFDYSDALCSAPIAAGKTETLSFTVAGPGRIRLTPWMLSGDAASGDKLVCTIGKETIDCIEEAGEITRFVGSGNQTVKVAVTRGKTSENDVAAALDPYFDEDGEMLPFEWTPATLVANPVPGDKTVGAEGDTFSWSEVPGVTYQVVMDANKTALTKTAVAVPCSDASFTPAGINPGTVYYWRVDTVLTDDEGNVAIVATNKAVWQVTMLASGSAIPMPVITDAEGNPVETTEPIEIVQGVAFTNVIGKVADGLTYKVLSGKLPDGLKLATDKATGLTTIAGVPTKVGDYTAYIQASKGTSAGGAVKLDFTVDSLALAEGTFNGILWADDPAAMEQNLSAASITFTAATSGKLSATVTVGGTKYSFSSSAGFSEIVPNEDGSSIAYATLHSVTKLGTVPYENTLEVAVYRGADTDDVWMAQLSTESEVSATLNLLTADKKSIQTDLAFTGYMNRVNSKDATWLAAAAAAEGYYTVSLPADSAASGAPKGAGYLTVTLDKKGAAKIAGSLADGVSFSASAVAVCRIGEDFNEQSIEIPVYFAKGTEVLAGVLTLVEDAEVSPAGESVLVVDAASSFFVWANADALSTYEAETGFQTEIVPLGGFYDSLFNLQTYYLNRELSFGIDDDTEFPEEFFEAYTGMSEIGAMPNGLSIGVLGNALSVAKKNIVKDPVTKLVDFDLSDNVCNLSLKFTRATGIMNGTFSLWLTSLAGTAQKEVTGIKYAGVFTPFKASTSAYQECPALGYFLVPVKLATPKSRTWNGSYLFKINGDDITEENEKRWASEGVFEEE